MFHTADASTPDHTEGLKNRRVFTVQDEIFGLPPKVFGAGLILTIGLGAATFILAGVLVALIYFPPMLAIHRDDPHALSVYFRAWQRRNTCWLAGHRAPFRCRIRHPDGSHVTLTACAMGSLPSTLRRLSDV